MVGWEFLGTKETIDSIGLVIVSKEALDIGTLLQPSDNDLSQGVIGSRLGIELKVDNNSIEEKDKGVGVNWVGERAGSTEGISASK